MVVLGANLGITSDGKPIYDGGACLIIDGEVFGAIAEERLTRRKHCGGYQAAADYLLASAGLVGADIDLLVLSSYGDEPRLELFKEYPLMHEVKSVAMIPSHHLSHAYSAFFLSPFDEALVFVADNEGNILGSRRYPELWKNSLERTSLFHAQRTTVTLIERDMAAEDIVSLGEIYGNVTRYIGFESYLNAGKTMGLAAYGDPRRFQSIPFIVKQPDGRIHCPISNAYLDASEELRRYSLRFGYKLPPQRAPEDSMTEVYIDLAAAVQKQLEEALIHKLRYWKIKTGLKDLCLSGGVALNCVANQRLLEEVPFRSISVDSNPGDQGQGFGNALFGWHMVLRNSRRVHHPGFYLGAEYSEASYLKAISLYSSQVSCRYSKQVSEDAAKSIANGAVVGWFQGRSEWGPRALGNRSILADPRKIGMKDYVNHKVKHRESFRPFAPAVPYEEASRYFAISQPMGSMTISANAKPEVKSRIPAVIHVDGTARLQTVTSSDNIRFHRLLCAFGELTGDPVVLNTSFNDNRAPIVETPEDALEAFVSSGLDALYLGDYVVTKQPTAEASHEDK